MNNSSPITFAILACGGRGHVYSQLLARDPARYRLLAAADPRPDRLDLIRELTDQPDFQSFPNDEALFAAGKLADVCLISTQDDYHVQPALRALELGYDLVLEKPIARDPKEIETLLDKADRLGRKVLVCHVLRYAPLYEKVRELLDSGAVGEVISIDAREGLSPWLQAHSYVRGSWAVEAKSNPMLLAKSCHDLDLICWFAGRPCQSVASFGNLSHFTAANRPEGAPDRCIDGCPVADSCVYNAMQYLDRYREFLYVLNRGPKTPDKEVLQWLREGPYGRCVYACDNDVVDHQVVALEFEGGITATLTMTAFDEGRDLIINGTKGRLRAGATVKRLQDTDIELEGHDGSRHTFEVNVPEGGYATHGGGDAGFINALADELAKPPKAMRSGIHASVESHRIAFLAERSRHEKIVCSLNR